MKTKAVGFFLCLLAIYVVSLSRSGGLANTLNQDRTGSPFSVGSCGNCHSGGSYSPSISLSVLDAQNNPVTTYIPGNSYVLEYTVTHGSGSPGGYAMQSTSMESGNTPAGTLTSTITPNTRISTISNRQYLEQSGVNSAGSFRANWTAPAQNTGAVTFYYAGLAVNGNGGTSGDQATSQVTTTLNEQCVAPVADFSFAINGGSVAFSDLTTNSPSTWSWDFGDGATSNLASPSHTYSSPGSYTVCMIANNCGADTVCKTVNVTCIGISVNLVSQTNVSCNGDSTGSISVNASGGLGTYSFAWQTGDVGPTLANIAAGSYSVTVTDSAGCQGTLQLQISEPTALTAALSTTDVGCKGDSTGSVLANTMGGITPYGYLWSSGATTNSVNSVPAGTYSVTVTDSNGCTINESETVNEPTQALGLSFAVTPTVSGQSNGAIDLTVSGGTPPYLFTWNNGSVGEDLVNLASGDYSVVVTDSNGCTVSDTVTVDALTSFGEDRISNVLKVFPNPARNWVTVEGDLEGKVILEMRDALGRKVLAMTEGNLPLQLQFGDLPSGVYLLKVEQAQFRKSFRVVVE